MDGGSASNSSRPKQTGDGGKDAHVEVEQQGARREGLAPIPHGRSVPLRYASPQAVKGSSNAAGAREEVRTHAGVVTRCKPVQASVSLSSASSPSMYNYGSKSRAADPGDKSVERQGGMMTIHRGPSDGHVRSQGADGTDNTGDTGDTGGIGIGSKGAINMQSSTSKLSVPATTPARKPVVRYVPVRASKPPALNLAALHTYQHQQSPPQGHK